MSKPAVIFVAAAMAVTAGCVSVIASFGLGLGFGESFAAGLAALAGMAVIHLAFLRVQPREDSRLDELDRFTSDLHDRLESIETRFERLESAMGDRARAATKPLVEEIAALGSLVTTVAKEVAAHDLTIKRLSAPKVEAPEPPPARAPEPPAPPPPAYRAETPAPQPRRASARPQIPAQPAKMQAPEPFDPGADDGAEAPLQAPLESRLERALAEDRIEPYLQPIVTLPSRRTAHYEAFSRLVEDDGVLAAAQFVDTASAEGKLPQLDRRILERCASVALRVSARGGGLLFLNVARDTLADPAAFGAISALLEAQQELRRLLVFETPQAVFEALSERERGSVEALISQGVRLSIDKVEDLRLDPRSLARRGVRFVKIRAERLLDPGAASGLAIHPADLANLLVRNGVELIATHVEEERTVPELLDMEVRLAQGELFGTPRPVRPAASDQGRPQPSSPRLVPRAATR
ncbi:EAL domain-containing protein [Chenggangzhangella methanolivorans]|uniref:EAL domain-containing protein n=1 Tax=Chenggangzhangella methanolivorans TaxID=1437009 RepID=A0A9E6R826_9HYPH|nr:EAL domain-containing protein [Chenggangzhangella methanolivorans]QZN99186.1 EAL domain-containing protein [Chenggangzhangella methanolivorans]